MNNRRGDPPEGYCTATVARRKLGNISDGRFRTLIGEGEGKIERWIPPGSKQGFYNLSHVNKLVNDWNRLAREADNPDLPGAHFQPATKEDMPEIIQLLIKIFGGGDTSAKRNAWLDRNPEAAFIVKSHGRIVGHIAILPLTEEKINDLLDKDRPQSFGIIEIDDVLPYEVGKPVNLFLLAMCSDDAGVSKVNRRKWGQVIVRGLFRHIEDLGSRGVPVNIVAARSDLKDGIRLMRHIGFTELEPKAGNRNFIIETKRSGLDFAMKHKAAYAEWKKRK
jgi:hypothetical protein